MRLLRDEVAKWRALAEANAKVAEACQRRHERNERLGLCRRVMPTDLAEREAFEAWISAPPFAYCIDRFPADDPYWPGCYQVLSVDLAWRAWQEAKKAERGASG